MDWNLFWAAFGAIGTTLGSTATAIALFVAIRQYKQPLKKKIKISFNSGITVKFDEFIGNLIHTITVSNIGVRPVIITNVYLRVGKKNLILNNLTHPKLPQPEFPYSLNQEEFLTMHFSCNMIACEFERLLAQGDFSTSDRVKVFVTDSTGGEYLFNIKCNAKKFSQMKTKESRHANT